MTWCWSQLKEGQSTPRWDYTKQRGDHQVDSGSLWAPLPAAICRGFAWRLQLPVSRKGFSVRTKRKPKAKQNISLEIVHGKIPFIPKPDKTRCDTFCVGDNSNFYLRLVWNKWWSLDVIFCPPLTTLTFNFKNLLDPGFAPFRSKNNPFTLPNQLHFCTMSNKIHLWHFLTLPLQIMEFFSISLHPHQVLASHQVA